MGGNTQKKYSIWYTKIYHLKQQDLHGPPSQQAAQPQLLKFSSSLAVSGKVSCLAALKTSCWDAIHKEAEAFRMDHIAVQQGAKMALKSTVKVSTNKTV